MVIDDDEKLRGRFLAAAAAAALAIAEPPPLATVDDDVVVEFRSADARSTPGAGRLLLGADVRVEMCDDVPLIGAGVDDVDGGGNGTCKLTDTAAADDDEDD